MDDSGELGAGGAQSGCEAQGLPVLAELSPGEKLVRDWLKSSSALSRDGEKWDVLGSIQAHCLSLGH